MNTEIIEYKGYKITVAQDEFAENPFESWDCEPPILTYHCDGRGSFRAYGDVESWYDILRLLPASTWKRGNRMAFLKEFILPMDVSLKDVAEDFRRVGEIDACADYLIEHYGSTPQGWGSATEWFDTAEALIKWAGIPCYNGQSNGYCQGDTALVLAIATPAWAQRVGAPADSLEAQCKSAVDLYGAWAWGDVYGVSEIHTPERNGVCAECDVEFPEDHESDCHVRWVKGEELPDGSCWGFYGRDHEESGLMDHARSIIDSHIEDMAEQEAAEAIRIRDTAINEPACLI